MKSESPSFVTTIPLATTPRDRSILRTRMKAARSAYNALLGECLKRVRLMRESRDFRAAKKLPKGKNRTTAFRLLNKRFGFEEYALYPFIQGQRKYPGIGDHLDAHTMQALAARAIIAAERMAFGKGGRPRFRRKGELRSVEGRSAHSPLRWDTELNRIAWSGLSLPAISDPDDEVIAHGLKHRVRFARIVRMVIKGKEHYYAQLVQEGKPLVKSNHRAPIAVVGLDIGPSTIAIVSDKAASLQTFCGELENRNQEIRRLQRQADRQVRRNNPQCFDDKGRWIKGQRAIIRSYRERQTRVAVAELQRREVAHRSNLHGRMVHQILAQGNDIRTEKLSYRSFQRNFGRSVKFRGPGLFVSRLKATADKMGGVVTEFDPRKPMLSQTCPKCGTLRKKKLSERWHDCSCGASVQRDLSSAHLARLVVGDKLDASKLLKAWKGACNLLRAASDINNGPMNGAKAHVLPEPKQGRGPSHVDQRHNPVSGSDVVAGRKVQARAEQKPGEDVVRAAANVNRSRLEIAGIATLEVSCKPSSRDERPPPLRQQELW